MTFPDTDTYMAAFPFDQSPDDASSPEMNYPTIKSPNTPLFLTYSPLCDGGHSANSSNLGFINNNDPHSFDSSYCNNQVELAKITEFETWSISQPIDPQRSAKHASLSYPPTLSSYQQQNAAIPSPSQKMTQRKLPLARANSVGGLPSSRPASSPNLSASKRRISSSGTPSLSPSTTTSDSSIPISTVTPAPKAKAPAKISHSSTERRYRENINSKLLQLDQTLSSARMLKAQSQQKTECPDEQDAEPTPVKARKADVLIEAMRYITQAERDSEAKNKEIDFLRLRLAALEKLVNCGDCALLKRFAGQQMNYLTDI